MYPSETHINIVYSASDASRVCAEALDIFLSTLLLSSQSIIIYSNNLNACEAEYFPNHLSLSIASVEGCCAGRKATSIYIISELVKSLCACKYIIRRFNFKVLLIQDDWDQHHHSQISSHGAFSNPVKTSSTVFDATATCPCLLMRRPDILQFLSRGPLRLKNFAPLKIIS
jgi:hypothetical protein